MAVLKDSVSFDAEAISKGKIYAGSDAASD